MSDRTALGDRMKRYEIQARYTLPRRCYTLLRVDGRSFHNYLRGAERPYDFVFMDHMDQVAVALCEEISGAVMAYTQSDEVMVLMADFASHSTEPWFGGRLDKQVSISAAVASTVLSRLRPGQRPALFDSRVFPMSDAVEVANAFIWRQRDAVRNSISMAAQAKFPHRELHGANTNAMQDMLFKTHGINWNDYPAGAKRGRVIVKLPTDPYVIDGPDGPIEVARKAWTVVPAPHFTCEPGEFLANVIPALPALG